MKSHVISPTKEWNGCINDVVTEKSIIKSKFVEFVMEKTGQVSPLAALKFNDATGKKVLGRYPISAITLTS